MNGQFELRERYAAVLHQIHDACGLANREHNAVQLLAVSKTFAADAVLALADLGQRAFGENYVQEAQQKIRSLADERPDLPLEWHFIGPIQSNKTRPIAESFTWVHSIERLKIAERLSAQRPVGMPPLNVCLQVSGEASKSGCSPAEVSALAFALAELPNLRLRGLMAIPEPTDDPSLQRRRFAHLRALFEQLRAQGLAIDTLSMGMSADLEAAIAEGSTLVRVGSAIFGSRTHS
jgi:PLP dependent protein